MRKAAPATFSEASINLKDFRDQNPGNSLNSSGRKIRRRGLRPQHFSSISSRWGFARLRTLRRSLPPQQVFPKRARHKVPCQAKNQTARGLPPSPRATEDRPQGFVQLKAFLVPKMLMVNLSLVYRMSYFAVRIPPEAGEF
jgi:hypothetical protein